MGEHHSVVVWSRNGGLYTDNRFSRGHRPIFDDGVEVPASASPLIVPLPLSQSAAVDPEEAFVASLSSCHMLWFLSIAAKREFVVDEYRHDAVGTMAKDASGNMSMTRVVLRPRVVFGGEPRPGRHDVFTMRHLAHEQFHIANSVKSEVLCEPRGETG